MQRELLSRGDNGVIIHTLQEVQAPDERTQRITPFGLGMTHILTPEATVAYQHDVLSGTDLVDGVPDGTRLSFERVRTTFVYGALSYDFFRRRRKPRAPGG